MSTHRKFCSIAICLYYMREPLCSDLGMSCVCETSIDDFNQCRASSEIGASSCMFTRVRNELVQWPAAKPPDAPQIPQVLCYDNILDWFAKFSRGRVVIGSSDSSSTVGRRNTKSGRVDTVESGSAAVQVGWVDIEHCTLPNSKILAINTTRQLRPTLQWLKLPFTG